MKKKSCKQTSIIYVKSFKIYIEIRVCISNLEQKYYHTNTQYLILKTVYIKSKHFRMGFIFTGKIPPRQLIKIIQTKIP